MRAMDSRRDFTSKKVFTGHFSELGEKANSGLVVDSLDKHMQNEKELIRLRRFMPAARTTRARSAQFRLRRELP